MLRALIFAMCFAFAATSSAQLYRWVDKDGKVRYGDTPPPGAKTSTLRAPATPAKPVAPDPAAKSASKAPLTPAQQEQEFRKRQLESRKAQEKADLARRDAEAKQQNCERAREYLRTLESGQRVSRTDAQGERYYLDDAAHARETEAARQAVRDWCG
jgi:hypothetical protein